MEINEIEQRVSKLEKEQTELKEFVNKSIGEIQTGIAEIKIMLQERLIQNDLKNDLLAKDINSQNERLKKIEDSQQWLWRTVAGSIVSIIIGAIVFVVKTMN